MFNVLIVDDEQYAIDALVQCVNWKSCDISDVFSANNAEEASKVLERNGVNIIICDIQMPGMNGIEFMENIIGIYHEIQFIFLTAHMEFEYAQKSLELGCYRYLLKPVEIERLEKIITELVLKLNEIEDHKFYEKNYDIYQNAISRLLQKDKRNTTQKQAVILDKKTSNQINVEINDSTAVMAVKNYILTNYASDISRGVLASLVYLNESYLSRLFKKTTGISISDYIAIVRMDKAKELLLINESITDVASSVGYSHVAHFSKMFKRGEGISPKEYRKRELLRLRFRGMGQ